MNNIEKLIKNALDANGYDGGVSGQISSEEMASIILFELQDQGILVESEWNVKQENGYYIWTKGENEFLSNNFKTGEFSCQCKNADCVEQKIAIELIDHLQWLREASNSPVRLHSGFRCKKHQDALRASGTLTVVATKTSQHELGNAVDVSSSRLTSGELLKLAELKFESIGIASNFLHLDLRQGKRRWNY